MQLFEMIIVKQKISLLLNAQAQKSVQILLQIIPIQKMMIMAPKLFSTISHICLDNFVFSSAS